MFYASIGGLAAGVGTAALVKGIEVANRSFGWLDDVFPFGRWSLVLVVGLGGFIAGAIVRYLGNESRGHGVPDVMYAFETNAGRMPWRVTLSGLLATVATIGSGGSAGQEGPAVHIGSGLASLVGSGLRVGQENRRLLVAVGAAGGISAVFNAPLTGSFFALEVVLRRFNVRNFSAVVLGAVLANVIYRGLMGGEEGLRSPAYSLDSGWEIFTFALLGIGTAIVAVLFVRTLSAVESLAERVNKPLIVPAIGGALVGVIGVWHGQVIGTGTEEIASFLQGGSGVQLLLLLVALKVVASSLTLGSGGTGGVFMPSLFLGAALGGAFGSTVHHFVPGASPAGAYAVAGMAGVFAGAASAPITSLLLAFEVSQDYGLVVPLMVVVVISTAASQMLMRETIYSEGLRRIGIDIRKERATDRLEAISVGAAAHPAAFEVPHLMPIDEVNRVFSERGADILPVVDGRKVVGMISVRDLLKAPSTADSGTDMLARDVMARPAVTVRQSDTLHVAVLRMDEMDLRALAVVDDDGRIAGVLDRAAILAAYAGATTAEPDPAPAMLHAIAPSTGRFERARVRPGGPMDGKTLRELGFPEGSLIVSIRRGAQNLVPRSSTLLQPGDQVVILCEDEARDELIRRRILGSPPPSGGAASKTGLRGAYGRIQRWRQHP
jgi:CIC family chloride channel protein